MTDMRGLLPLFASLTLISLILPAVGATYLQVEGPITSGQLPNNGSIYLGKVGPGESFYVLASATTANQSGAVINIGWDKLQAVNLPSGWSSDPSLLYANPMKMKVTVAPSAANGTYQFGIRAVNVGNYSKLGNLTLNAYVNVTPNVFTSSVTPRQLVAGVGQPVNLYITINNTGASDDPFLINAYGGLPAWNAPFKVIAIHATRNTYVYPVFVNVSGVYNFNLTINSTTSQLIRKSYPIQLVAQSSVINDYGATGQGVVLSPMIYEPAYAIMLLLKGAYALIFR
jgi:hypothetical protein